MGVLLVRCPFLDSAICSLIRPSVPWNGQLFLGTAICSPKQPFVAWIGRLFPAGTKAIRPGRFARACPAEHSPASRNSQTLRKWMSRPASGDFSGGDREGNETILRFLWPRLRSTIRQSRVTTIISSSGTVRGPHAIGNQADGRLRLQEDLRESGECRGSHRVGSKN